MRMVKRIIPANGRRALKLLADSTEGCTETLLLAHGVAAEIISALVRTGLARATTGTMMAGGRLVDVTRLRITDAGRQAWAVRTRPGRRAASNRASSN
jgi:hypothetical protein